MQKSVKLNLLLFVCMISNISYYPDFVGVSTIRLVTIGLWGLLAIVSMKTKLYLNQSMQTMLAAFFMFIMVSFVSFIAGNEAVFQNHFFFTIIIAIVILMVGLFLGNSFTKEDIKRLCKCYMYITVIMAVFLFLFYLRGTDIYSIQYMYRSGKNEIAVLLMCALAIVFTVYDPKNTIQYAFQFFSIAILIVDIFLLKCRSVMLAIVPMFLFVLISKKYLNKKFRIIFISLIAVGAIFLLLNKEYLDIIINQFIFANRDSTSVDDLSSGRLDQIKEGLKVFNENWLIGVGDRKTLDCMYVSILANYGILCFPIVIMAIYPVIWAFKNLFSKKSNRDSIAVCFLFIALGMFIVSFLEELAPFGSGVRCYILWLLFGMLLGMESVSNSNFPQNVGNATENKR